VIQKFAKESWIVIILGSNITEKEKNIKMQSYLIIDGL